MVLLVLTKKKAIYIIWVTHFVPLTERRNGPDVFWILIRYEFGLIKFHAGLLHNISGNICLIFVQNCRKLNLIKKEKRKTWRVLHMGHFNTYFIQIGSFFFVNDKIDSIATDLPFFFSICHFYISIKSCLNIVEYLAFFLTTTPWIIYLFFFCYIKNIEKRIKIKFTNFNLIYIVCIDRCSWVTEC